MPSEINDADDAANDDDDDDDADDDANDYADGDAADANDDDADLVTVVDRPRAVVVVSVVVGRVAVHGRGQLTAQTASDGRRQLQGVDDAARCCGTDGRDGIRRRSTIGAALAIRRRAAGAALESACSEQFSSIHILEVVNTAFAAYGAEGARSATVDDRSCVGEASRGR